MFKDIFENHTRIFNLRLQVATLCLYNFLITFIALSQERLVWSYDFGGSQYADKLGLALAIPLLTPKFGSIFCFLSILLNSFTLFPIFYPEKTLKYYLLPGIIWNIYTLAAHFTNIIAMIYDLIILSTDYKISLNLIIVSVFLMTLHFMLFLNSLSYYDYIGTFLPDMNNITIDEIEDYFSGNCFNLLMNDFQEENRQFYENYL